MNSALIRVCVKQAGLWCILVIAVVLLTMLFTILGTITCAVLTGVMMASTRHQRWQTIPVSIVFPGVVAALGSLARVELVGQQRIFLPALCFGAFWLTYFLMGAVAKLESKAVDVSAAPITAQTEKMEQEPVKELRLEDLQGKWVLEATNANATGAKKILEVAGNHVSLSVVESEGRAKLVGGSKVKLDGTEPLDRVTDAKPTRAY